MYTFPLHIVCGYNIWIGICSIMNGGTILGIELANDCISRRSQIDVIAWRESVSVFVKQVADGTHMYILLLDFVNFGLKLHWLRLSIETLSAYIFVSMCVSVCWIRWSHMSLGIA